MLLAIVYASGHLDRLNSLEHFGKRHANAFYKMLRLENFLASQHSTYQLLTSKLPCCPGKVRQLSVQA